MALMKQLFIFCLLAAVGSTADISTTTESAITDTPVLSTTADTPDPGTTTDTPAPSTTTDTPAPGTTTDTPAPGTTTDTPDPGTTTDTPAPGTTTDTPDPGTTTDTPAPGTTTGTPAPGTTTGTPAPSTTTPVPGPCASNPCPRDSTCEELFEDHRCLCRPGLYYNVDLNSCIFAKIFPSELRVTETFIAEMENKDSEIFKTTAEQIVAALNQVFKDQPGYIESTVLSLRQGSVIADVENVFNDKSEVTDQEVLGLLTEAAKAESGTLAGAEVTPTDPCSKQYCEDRTTDCDAKDGIISCTCKLGYVISPVTSQSCFACPSGQRAVNSETCELCSFGYSGFNCDESYLLIVVIISCVLGTLLLATLVAVIVLSCRGSEKTTTSSNESDAFNDMDFRKPVGIPRIPRANHNSGWQPANLETTDSSSTRALVTKDRPDSIAMEKYYDPYNDDTRGYRSQASSKTGYGNGNGNGSRGTRNPYYEPGEDAM